MGAGRGELRIQEGAAGRGYVGTGRGVSSWMGCAGSNSSSMLGGPALCLGSAVCWGQLGSALLCQSRGVPEDCAFRNPANVCNSSSGSFCRCHIPKASILLSACYSVQCGIYTFSSKRILPALTATRVLTRCLCVCLMACR
jgi:hypothetical protein